MGLNTQQTINIQPNQNGFYGDYGGQFLDENLKNEFQKITNAFLILKEDKKFNEELDLLYKHYVGRPSSLYYAQNLSTKYGAEIYLKREDLNHTGSHKINNVIGQVLLARKAREKP